MLISPRLDYGSWVWTRAARLHVPSGYTLQRSGEYEFSSRARKRPTVIPLIFVLLYRLILNRF